MFNTYLKIFFFTGYIGLTSGHGLAQLQITPYDRLPEIPESYKPVYEEGLPAWGKMLYLYPVNLNEINRLFETYRAEHPGTENALTRYYQIWRQQVEIYAAPDGNIKLPDLNVLRKRMLKLQTESECRLKGATVTPGSWSFLGPVETHWLNTSGSHDPRASCPWQANIYALDVAPSDHQIIYCGSETGYLNKTTDMGRHWQLMAPQYYFGAIRAIAVDPENENIVYIASGEQIHKSTDGGQTWVPLLTGGLTFKTDRLRIDPQNPLKVIAAANTGVYITRDGGAAWSQKFSEHAYDVEVNPGDPDKIYALTATADGYFALAFSEDGGDTFTHVPEFPGDLQNHSGGLLAVTPANPDLLFAVMLTKNGDHTPCLYKGALNQGGWTWSRIATGKTDDFQMNNGQGYFDLILAVSPTNAQQILVGTTTLFRSTDGGAHFSAVGGYWGPFPIHPDIQDVKMLSNGETWVSTDGGMNLTTDFFTTSDQYYVRVNGLHGSDMWGFDQGWNEDLVVGGRYHNGNTAIASFYQPVALRMGGAESPTGWVLQGKSRHVAFNDLGNGWILPETARGAPEGRFIFSKYPNMDEYGGRRSNLVFHPNYYGVVYVGEGDGLWKSEDMGTTWNLVKTFPDRVRFLQISYRNPEVIYVDVKNRGLYRTEDAGVSWTLLTSLTNGRNGSPSWKGRLHFVISPYDAQVIYACLSNGTWSSDLGKVFRSTDGGVHWDNWTGSASGVTKCLAIQPTTDGKDLVYLFTSAKNGHLAEVYYRKTGMADWVHYDQNYPAGTSVNLALPFYRDSKIRVGGNCGVWEAPLAEPVFTPILNPWVDKPVNNCMLDTLYFDDHSILNHEGASWEWHITPEPAYLDDPHSRHPKVVLGAPGSYDVTMKVIQNGQTYIRTIEQMVTTTTCPSLDNCNNPADIPKTDWRLLYCDSQQTGVEDGRAVNAFDGDPNTIWHTQWVGGAPGHPHEISINLGRPYAIHRFTLLNRSNGQNGRIKDYELYFSDDPNTGWGAPVMAGQFENTAAPQYIDFHVPVITENIRLVALSEVNGNPWTSVAEISLTGCYGQYLGKSDQPMQRTLHAFPVPTDGIIHLAVPYGNTYRYRVYSGSGQVLTTGKLQEDVSQQSFDLTRFKPGLYLIIITGNSGVSYRVKVLKR